MTEPADGILERHEPAYAEWLAANPPGFVFLTRTSCMHRAGCRSVRPLRMRERWPSFWLGGAWVSRSVAMLDYALAAMCDSADRCTRCKPGSDPKGVAMMAEYVARLRGLEPPPETGTEIGPVDVIIGRVAGRGMSAPPHTLYLRRSDLTTKDGVNV